MARRTRTKPTPVTPDPRQRIVEAAIALADETGWYDLSLRRLAERLGLGLAELRSHFRDADAIADACFDRALTAMLARATADLARRPARERLFALMDAWFRALAPHRRVVGQMIATKLYPAHLHHGIPMVFHLSRLIQWWRDAAGLEATGPRRSIEEIALTLLFLATLVAWLNDETPDQARARRFLDAGLGAGERAAGTLFEAPTERHRHAAR